MKKIAVIGSGFSGLSSAAYLAKAGYDVTVYEKNDTIGGRCRQFKANGFTFDMGPSWYWMPEVFASFFQDFGKEVADFYQLEQLDPAYSIQFSSTEKMEVSANFEQLKKQFEEIEKGAGEQLEKFLADAEKKYDAGMNRFVHQPSLSIFEFAKLEILKGLIQLDLFRAFSKHVRKYFKHPHLIQLLEFPVLFLGATPQEIPALYSLMNFADLKGGTWYPQTGMHAIITAMEKVCEENGVEIKTNHPVSKINVNAKGKAESIRVNEEEVNVDVIVGSADYHHIDRNLLDAKWSNYPEKYWNDRKMAPSCVLFYVGVDKKLQNIHHHNLFFDTDFEAHSAEIYSSPKWPKEPLFYVCAPSVTDETVAPKGCENLFFLVPLAPDLKDDEAEREIIFSKIMERFEQHTKQKVQENIIYKKSFAMQDFKSAYNSYKGNAYGLANTLRQTAFLKPKIANKKINNLFYTGQLTVPGPGVPPAIISGKVVAEYILKTTST